MIKRALALVPSLRTRKTHIYARSYKNIVSADGQRPRHFLSTLRHDRCHMHAAQCVLTSLH